MSLTLYASFGDATLAERAIGALVDRGARPLDLFAMFPTRFANEEDSNREKIDKIVQGVTTTSLADAALGAGKGAELGLGLGAVAALAALAIPGFGIVTGGGALVAAVLGMAGSAMGGAIVGGMTGYFQDQGAITRVPDVEGGPYGTAILAVEIPTGHLGEFEVREIFHKYHARSYGRAQLDRPLAR